MENNNLKPCVFCGSTDVVDLILFVKCNNCLAQGPQINVKINKYCYGINKRFKETSKKLWNTTINGEKNE